MVSEWLVEKQAELGNFQCPDCDKFISDLGQHWREYSKCRPGITEKQHEVIKGILLGDGYLKSRDEKNPLLNVRMVAREYLQYLDECIFPAIGTGVNKILTAEESAKKAIESGLRGTTGNVENYNDLYRWNTSAHPELSKYKGWYTQSGKVWPNGLILTPTVLKHWYVGDGHCSENYIQISMSTENNKKEKVNNYFNKSKLPEPNWYGAGESNDPHYNMRWNKEDSKTLLEYMGEPVPGFEYKWTTNGR